MRSTLIKISWQTVSEASYTNPTISIFTSVLNALDLQHVRFTHWTLFRDQNMRVTFEMN